MITNRENLDMRKATLQKTLVWKAAALVAGLGLAMLSYPVHAAPVSSGDAVQSLYGALLVTMKKGSALGQSGRFLPRRRQDPSRDHSD
jgi:hypothetical protein